VYLKQALAKETEYLQWLAGRKNTEASLKEAQAKVSRQLQAEKVLDPANIATGANQFMSTDFSYTYFEIPVRIERYYNSQDERAFAFGRGWHGSFESRVVFGVKRGYAEEVRELEKRKLDFEALLAKAAQIMLANPLNEEIHRYYLQTLAPYTRLEALLATAKEEAYLAECNRQRNRLVVDYELAPEQFISNTCLLYIDEAGVSYVYRLESSPDFATTARYADGSPNFYPRGSALAPLTPADYRLDLDAEGRVTVRKKDGTKLLYSMYGQLERLEDTAGHSVSFSYSGRELTRLTDGFNRSLSFLYTAGYIASITDLQGRKYRYEYNSGMLAAVTDPAGRRTRYEYTGGVMSKQIYPGGKSVSYYYQWTTSEKYIYVKAQDSAGHLWAIRLRLCRGLHHGLRP
jgi:YD repeat-containing protein